MKFVKFGDFQSKGFFFFIFFAASGAWKWYLFVELFKTQKFMRSFACLFYFFLCLFIYFFAPGGGGLGGFTFRLQSI